MLVNLLTEYTTYCSVNLENNVVSNMNASSLLDKFHSVIRCYETKK